MPSLAVSIPLPRNVKQELSRLCHGLPFTKWLEEESLAVLFFRIDRCDSSRLLDVREALSDLIFPSFSITLKAISCTQNKRLDGSLRVDVELSDPFKKFISEISRILKAIFNDKEFHPLKPHIPLGTFRGLSHQKISSFLETNSYFRQQDFMATSFCLLVEHKNEKSFYYTVDADFPLIYS